MNQAQFNKSQHKDKIQNLVMAAERLRRDTTNPEDVTLSEMVENDLQLSMEELYADLGIDPSVDTIDNLFTLPDASVRWLVPELIRDAMRLGLRKSAIWPSLIRAEETVKGLQGIIPSWNMSDAKPKIVGEAETISLGTVSIGQKQVSLKKFGRGIKISYEVKQFCSMNVVSIFLQDFGVKLGAGLDYMAINVLVNGDTLGGGESAAVIGVGTANTLVYKDLMRAWVRMSRLGKNPRIIIAGETVALDTLDLSEFKNRQAGTPLANVTFKTPMPTNTDYYVHSAIANDQQLIVDPDGALIKYNATPLLIESEKIVSNQTEATYATFYAGFGTLYRDSRLIIDRSVAFSGNGFPSWMDPSTEELVIFD